MEERTMRVCPGIETIHQFSELERRSDAASSEQVGDLTMNREVKGTVLHIIEVESVVPTGKVEGTDEGSFVGEECTFHEIEGLGVF